MATEATTPRRSEYRRQRVRYDVNQRPCPDVLQTERFKQGYDLFDASLSELFEAGISGDEFLVDRFDFVYERLLEEYPSDQDAIGIVEFSPRILSKVSLCPRRQPFPERFKSIPSHLSSPRSVSLRSYVDFRCAF